MKVKIFEIACEERRSKLTITSISIANKTWKLFFKHFKHIFGGYLFGKSSRKAFGLNRAF